MYTYKNVSDQHKVLVGIGEVDGGGTINSAVIIENPCFELVDAPQQSTVQQPVEAPAPAPEAPKVQVTVPADQAANEGASE